MKCVIVDMLHACYDDRAIRVIDPANEQLHDSDERQICVDDRIAMPLGDMECETGVCKVIVAVKIANEPHVRSQRPPVISQTRGGRKELFKLRVNIRSKCLAFAGRAQG